jgi:hypothetical protein
MAENKPIDYTAMDAPGVLSACADDGHKWAAAFKQHAEKLGHIGMDEGWLIGWFCNAIEGSADTRRWRNEATARDQLVQEHARFQQALELIRSSAPDEPPSYPGDDAAPSEHRRFGGEQAGYSAGQIVRKALGET